MQQLLRLHGNCPLDHVIAVSQRRDANPTKQIEIIVAGFIRQVYVVSTYKEQGIAFVGLE